MTNPLAGEVSIHINGTPHACKLTLGVLVELEEALGEDTLLALIQRFEGGKFASRDVMALIVAGLRGGGWTGTAADLKTAEIADGPLGAARAAAMLLARAFTVPA